MSVLVKAVFSLEEENFGVLEGVRIDETSKGADIGFLKTQFDHLKR